MVPQLGKPPHLPPLHPPLRHPDPLPPVPAPVLACQAIRLDGHDGSYNSFFFLNCRHLLPVEPLFQGKLLLEGWGTVFLDLDDLAFLGD